MDYDENYGKCILRKKCKHDECEKDTYLLHGYGEDDLEDQFESIDAVPDDRRTFECHLPLSKCEYNLSCVLDALHREISKHSKGEKIDIVGLCFGAIIADEYAKIQPEKVNKIGLINSFSRLYPWTYLVKSIIDDTAHVRNFIEYRKRNPYTRNSSHETFEYNCALDNITIGSPPAKEGGIQYYDPFCLHEMGMQKMKPRLKHFLSS